MRNALTSRGLISRALLIGLLAGFSGRVFAQHRVASIVRLSPSFSRGAVAFSPVAWGQQQRPAPIERRAPPSSRPANGTAGMNGVSPNPDRANGHHGEHLPEWMDQHRGLTLQQQQQALESEPGFRELPPQTQQRMLGRLAQLHAMAPVERQRLLENNEAMERLSLAQRSQVRGVMEQLGSLPPDQRRQVSRSFRELSLLPPNQRMGMLIYSGRYSWLNEVQRTTLMNLIQVAPMLPPPEPPQPR